MPFHFMYALAMIFNQRSCSGFEKQVWSTNRCVLSTFFSTWFEDRRTDQLTYLPVVMQFYISLMFLGLLDDIHKKKWPVVPSHTRNALFCLCLPVSLFPFPRSGPLNWLFQMAPGPSQLVLGLSQPALRPNVNQGPFSWLHSTLSWL